jgi:hypothetical protein
LFHQVNAEEFPDLGFVIHHQYMLAHNEPLPSKPRTNSGGEGETP